MKIGIDIDGTITHAGATEFFRQLTHEMKAEIHIITARAFPEDPDYDDVCRRTCEELDDLGIRYDKLACVGPGRKVAYIVENGIQIMFDDTDEEVVASPPSCIVFKIREDMNFCWESNRWIHSDKTSVDITKDTLSLGDIEKHKLPVREPSVGGIHKIKRANIDRD